MTDAAIPILRVHDAAIALRWYEQLEFTKEWEHQFEPGFPLFVSISRNGGFPLYLSEHSGDAVGPTLLYLVSADFDLDQLAEAHGCEVQAQDWAREVELTDPDGNRLRLAEPAS